MTEIDYTSYLIDIQTQIDSLNTTSSGLNESLSLILETNTQISFMMELTLYMVVVFVLSYLIGVMLKITFSR